MAEEKKVKRSSRKKAEPKEPLTLKELNDLAKAGYAKRMEGKESRNHRQRYPARGKQ